MPPKAPPPCVLAWEREENRQAVIQARVMAAAVATEAARLAEEWARRRGQDPPPNLVELTPKEPPPAKPQARGFESFPVPVQPKKASPPTLPIGKAGQSGQTSPAASSDLVATTPKRPPPTPPTGQVNPQEAAADAQASAAGQAHHTTDDIVYVYKYM